MKLSRTELELETIVNRIERGELDLQPNFQRGEIWDGRRRQRLIDSILRDWYVPAVHIVHEESGNEVVLDGQQRLSAVSAFFRDEFAVDGRTQPESDEIAALNGLRFSGLPENYRRAIRRFALPVVTLREFEPGEPNELFFRLNQSYNLTPSEKRNALHGRARDQVKDVVDRLSQEGLLVREAIGFSNGRLAYDDIIARTCVALEHDDLNIHINNNVVEEFYRKKEFDDETVARVERAGLDLLAQIKQSATRLRFNKGSLFTWLIYLDWAPRLSSSVPADLLASFEAARASAKSGELSKQDAVGRVLRECVELYDDRVSYRVTDVSSVLIRDLMVHVYSCLAFDSEPVGLASALVRRLLENEGYSVASVVADYLDVDSWGAGLRGVSG